MKPQANSDRKGSSDIAAAPDRASPSELAAAIDKLWVRFLPDIRQRVDLLQAAAVACAANTLLASQREAAHAAAHKLAGTLGTFNLFSGTELAREFELAFSNQAALDSTLAERLASIAAELRMIVDSRK
jgi:HPt (histidine-containing phosphotransfer) domain-containing protein